MAHLSRRSHEITDVLILESAESRRRGAIVRWTDEQFRINEFIRERLKMPKCKKETPAQLLGGGDKFHRPAGIGGDLHREFVIVIVGKGVKGNANLLQVAQAFDAPAAFL